MYRDTTNFTTPSNPVESKPDVFSLEGLIAWLEKQPPINGYCYTNSGGCLLHQYLAASGVAVFSVGPHRYSVEPNYIQKLPLPDGFEYVAVTGQHTYGAALTRARQLMKGG